jgi:hypothetical protein
LARDVTIPSGIGIDKVVNDGTPEEAASRFITILNRVASHVPPG